MSLLVFLDPAMAAPPTEAGEDWPARVVAEWQAGRYPARIKAPLPVEAASLTTSHAREYVVGLEPSATERACWNLGSLMKAAETALQEGVACAPVPRGCGVGIDGLGYAAGRMALRGCKVAVIDCDFEEEAQAPSGYASAGASFRRHQGCATWDRLTLALEDVIDAGTQLLIFQSDPRVREPRDPRGYRDAWRERLGIYAALQSGVAVAWVLGGSGYPPAEHLEDTLAIERSLGKFGHTAAANYVGYWMSFRHAPGWRDIPPWRPDPEGGPQ